MSAYESMEWYTVCWVISIFDTIIFSWYMSPKHDPKITFDTYLLNLFLPSLKFRHSEIFHSHRGQKTASCICLWNLNICCNWKNVNKWACFPTDQTSFSSTLSKKVRILHLNNGSRGKFACTMLKFEL